MNVPCLSSASSSTRNRFSAFPAQATLEEIRAAYREKAKRYHPDKGGEDWTFRILSQAYEMLSTARVARAQLTGSLSPAQAARPQAQGRSAQAQAACSRERPEPERQTESVHAGIFDHETPRGRASWPSSCLCIRYLWDDADYLWLTQRVPDEERFLSCNLTISWPDEDRRVAVDLARRARADPRDLARVFDQHDHHHAGRQLAVADRTTISSAAGSLTRISIGRTRPWACSTRLLKSRGLGMRQWSRDLFIPRSRR